MCRVEMTDLLRQGYLSYLFTKHPPVQTGGNTIDILQFCKRGLEQPLDSRYVHGFTKIYVNKVGYDLQLHYVKVLKL